MGAAVGIVKDALPQPIKDRLPKPPAMLTRWDGFKEAHVRTYNPANVTTCMLGVAGDSSLVITGDAKGYGTFWDMDYDEKGAMVGVRDWHSMAVTDMCWLNNFPLLAEANMMEEGNESVVTKMKVLASELGPKFMQSEAAIQARAMREMHKPLPCRGALATCSLDRTIKVWNLEKGLCLIGIPTKEPCTCMALLPSGILMVGSGTSPDLFGYDLIKGEAIVRCIGHKEPQIRVLKYIQ